MRFFAMLDGCVVLAVRGHCAAEIQFAAMVKTMRKRSSSSMSVFKIIFWFALLQAVVACGYSQEEWDQKVRENESTLNQLNAQRQANRKCEADYGAAQQQIDDLKKQLLERGVNVDNLSQSLEEQRRANEEFRRRAEQLDEIKQRFEQLRDKLKKLTQLGLKVEVRDNRMLIQLPGDVLFDSGEDKLKQGGKDILRQVSEVLRGDPELLKREFQVAGHTDSKPPTGWPFQGQLGPFRDARPFGAASHSSRQLNRVGEGLDPKKWSAAGYADTDPVANNDTDDGRMKNRRVELVVLPNVEEMLNLNSLTL